MALTQLTKIDGGGISTTSDYRVGVITASKFVGPFDGTTGNFSGVITATTFKGDGDFIELDVDGHTNLDNVSIAGVVTAGTLNATTFGPISGSTATFTGNVSIGGTLTYEDVTNIDSVGIITAQKDIHVGAGISAVGVITGRYLNPSSVSTQNVIIGWEQSARNVTGSWNVLLGRRAGEGLTSAGLYSPEFITLHNMSFSFVATINLSMGNPIFLAI